MISKLPTIATASCFQIAQKLQMLASSTHGKHHSAFLCMQATRTSGILSLCSLSALTLPTIKTMPINTEPMMAVFALQFLGCAYQPPAGDQTCFG